MESMADTEKVQKELELKEQRISFWERHHRLMPKKEELFYDLVFSGPLEELQHKQ